MREVARGDSMPQLVSYICEESFSSLPDQVIAAASRQIVNTVGNIIGGQRGAPGRIILHLFSQLGGSDQATILATGERRPLLHAVFANAALANSLDYDDMFAGPDFGGHPCSAIVPAALAVAEQLDCTGQELITAMVVGYEIAVRIGAAIAPTKERAKQVLPLATWQSLGAAAAAAKLMQLSEEQIAHALALAAVLMPVPSGRKWGELREDPGPVSWMRNGYGWASMGAVLASQLAEKGFQGNVDIFEGSSGFWAMAGSDRFAPQRLTEGLGEGYRILRGCIKRYPAIWVFQSPLEALAILRDELGIEAKDVKQVNLEVCSRAANTRSAGGGVSAEDVPFNLPHLSALLLSRLSLLDVSSEILRERTHLALARKVDVRETEQSIPAGESPATATVRFGRGATASRTVEYASGDYRAPLNDRELQGKFGELVSPYVEPERSETIFQNTLHLATASRVGDMMRRWYGG